MGNQIGPEIDPAQKIGETQGKHNRKSREKPIWRQVFLVSGRDLFPDLFCFQFQAEGPKTYFLASRLDYNAKTILTLF